MDDNKSKYESYEKALKNLKEIVQQFENMEDMSMEDLLSNYEKGMNAYSFCMEKLEDTHKKIKIIDSKFE